MWYGRLSWGVCLAPLGLAWGGLARARRLAFRVRWLPSYRVPVPVIVVGNIAAGGTGKTPLVIWLANQLREAGYRPGILCSGYRGSARHWPQQVRPDSDPVVVGDEAVLVAEKTGAPVAADRNRVRAARALITHSHCDLIISDDGLQHLALERDLEIAVLDAKRRHGNGLCLPAGPLREPASRLKSVDFVVANGVARRGEIAMELRPERLRQLLDPSIQRAPSELSSEPVHAVAGIGNPQRFFELLRNLGFKVIPHPFPDHYKFRRDDLIFDDDRLLVMTEKDAVKCRTFSDSRYWFLPVSPALASSFRAQILALLARRCPQHGVAGPGLTPERKLARSRG